MALLKAGRESSGERKVVAPTISLPKGGGAIRGLGEKLAANPATGTGAMSVPIAVSPARSGFSPRLALSYDSGSGNGPFGFGWTLSLPAITRKTDKGLPRYLDADESDVYLLSGAEDLVPWLLADGTRFRDDTTSPGFVIHRYRPRVEGLFARIERWTDRASGTIHWRSISRDNVTTLYGKDVESRISDASGSRTFSWLACESYDDKGNAIRFRYQAEDDSNVDASQANERNRERLAGRYPKSILYGNRVSRLIQPDLALASWMFEVVFDYDDGHYEDIAPDPTVPADAQHRFALASAVPTKTWTNRPDPFSSYRAGFEVRTHRRCRRVLMFHHIPALLTGERGYDGLVRSLEFDYADLDYTQPVSIDDELAHPGSTRVASFLRTVTSSGYVRDEAKPLVDIAGVPFATYLKRSFPATQFEYSQAVIADEVREADAETLQNLPAGLADTSFRCVDLDGEGVSGILAEQAGAWFYKPSLGDGRFGALQSLARQPAVTALGGGRQQLLDLAGDGQLDLVEFSTATAGFYERTFDRAGDGDWDAFRSFRQLPNIRWDDRNLRFLDLNGDGHADVLIAENELFTWYPSLGEDGFGPAIEVSLPPDDQRGPRLVFADGEQSVHLADMSGDGLTDLVRIRNGEVCYWPNLGYGRFGAQVTMDDAPRFDRPDQFDERRIRLADVDGSGSTDILYLGRDGVRIYFNQSGNRLSAPRRLAAFPPVDDVSTVVVTDLLGNGTGCLVWSSSLPGDARSPLRYVDLMGGTKPHLLVRTVNNLGAETRVRYAPSTLFYLADKKAGNPWVTRLPFPVHVLERVETYDHVSGNRFVTRYTYHHGYFDGVEREFRGFGMVEQIDSEELAALTEGGALGDDTNIDATSHVPPLLTRTWFHTGVYLGRDHVSDYFAGLLGAADRGEYYREPGLDDTAARARLLDDTILPAGLTVDEEREACRALKGAMLRQEIYALDGTPREQHPYTLVEQNLTVRVLQRQAGNRHAVFLTHPREALSHHYEREPTDPRVSHALTLEVDDTGNILASAAVAYGRRQPDATLSPADQARQMQLLVTYDEHRFTNGIDAADAYRTPLPCEARSHELTGLTLAPGRLRFAFDEVRSAGAAATIIEYQTPVTTGVVQKRLIEHMRTTYRRDDLTGPLPLGVQEPLALPHESCKLALTPGLVDGVYSSLVTNVMLESDGRYVHSEGDGQWWVPSEQIFFSPDPAATPAEELAFARHHFFLPHRIRDAFHSVAASTEGVVTYDGYDLLVHETRDALGNRTTVGERHLDPTQPPILMGHDYRVLQPTLVMDPNRNRIAVALDALGFLAGTAQMGKPEDSPAPGDRLTATFRADLTPAEIDSVLADPAGPVAVSFLDDATNRVVYDLTAFQREPNPDRKPPAVAAMFARETHASEPTPIGGLRLQVTLSYSDGFGREIQKKAQAEPGRVPVRGSDGAIVVGPDGQPVLTAADVSPRWVGRGWTVFNNKGKPVRQFEPFFTDTHRFERDVRIGVSAVLCYDPSERVVATLRPNHTWEKMAFGPWRQEQWDASDTVLTDPTLDDTASPFFKRLPDATYRPSWFAQRSGGGLGADEQDAATKTALHAGTPTVIHADALGRAFLTDQHNRFERNAIIVDEHYITRVEYDVEGNQREVTDANDRVVVRYDYDMLGTAIRQASVDAGERRMLNDILGAPLYAWDDRGHRVRTHYDQLHRAIESSLRVENDPEQSVARTIYGETQSNPEVANLRGQVVQLLDQAGVVGREAFDFKGNVLRTRRQLAREYKETLDWSAGVALESETFVSTTAYDALSRPTASTTPDGSVLRPTFNQANLLESIAVTGQGAMEATPFVVSIDYNARGQRERIALGNGVTTSYRYDPLTLRLHELRTNRANNPDVLQAQVHTYDPSGNITRLRDEAKQAVYFNNQVVSADGDYGYDAVYRLIVASGREHIGQVSRPETTWENQGRVGLAHPADGQAMRRYTERYHYDPVGNFQELVHQAGSGSWTRAYAYDEASLLQPGKRSNRLSRTTVGATSVESYGHDAHGNMTSIPHLSAIVWDFQDQLKATSRQVVAEGPSETTYHAYQAGDQRVRKVTERANGTRKNERICVAGIEIYREFAADGISVTLERQTLHVMDDRRRVAMVDTRTRGDEAEVPRQLVRYQVVDRHGTTSLELDEQAQIISYEEYTPYGATSFQEVRGALKSAQKRYRYVGMERDEESGFAHHGARYYLPWLGRWSSADPIGIAGGINLYRYADDEPIGRSDTNGRETAAEINQRQTRRVEEFFRFADVNRDGLITVKEFRSAIMCTTLSRSDVQIYGDMARGDYRFEPGLEDDISFNPRIDYAKAYEMNENQLRAHSDGINYTNKSGREATARSLNRHRDPQRVVNMAKFGAMVLAPEYYFTASSIYHSAKGEPQKAAEDLAGVLVGRLLEAALPVKPVERGGPSGVQIGKFKTEPGGQGNWAGHGTYRHGDGTVTIPEGTTLIIPRDNVRILNPTGQILERGAWWEVEAIRIKPAAERTALERRILDDLDEIRVCKPGDKIENYTLDWPKGLTVHEKSVLVGEPTDLGELLKPNMGCKIWAACTEYVP